MSDKLSKRPNTPLFWLVLASGLTVVLIELAGFSGGGTMSLVARTVFWCAAIAYFAVRLYQFSVRKKDPGNEQPPDSEQSQN